MGSSIRVYALFTFFTCIVTITVCADGVALVSERENVCGSWTPFKDEKCIKVITTAKYDKKSGDSVCRSYSEVFDTNYSLLRINNEDEQNFFSRLIFKEKGIKENVWLEYNVEENKIPVLAGNDQTNVMNFPVYFYNWAKTDQTEKHGLCVQLLPGTNDTDVGMWDRVNCNQLNIVVCERPQPVTMESLQAKHHQMENIIRLLLKEQRVTKECETESEVRNIALGKPVKHSSTFPGGYVASHGNDGNIHTLQITNVGNRYPWWRIDLLQPHEVRIVAVYARPGVEGRFHDVSIVVSNTDISTTPPKTIFNPGNDSICLDNIGSDSVVGPAWTYYDCKQVVVGRYLSFQITADCKPERTDCNYPGDNQTPGLEQLLELMEVEVYIVWPRTKLNKS